VNFPEAFAALKEKYFGVIPTFIHVLVLSLLTEVTWASFVPFLRFIL
jgi:hypothetical protein